jgi:hypothetical protein
MVVTELHVIGIAIEPAKADAPLVIVQYVRRSAATVRRDR